MEVAAVEQPRVRPVGADGVAKVGALTIKENSPTSLLTTPLCLQFNYPTNSGCEILTNTAKELGWLP